MKSKILKVTILCLFFMALSVVNAASIRIMPLGDSITEGDGGISMDDDSLIVGYRQKLYLDLLDAGYNNVDFVGSLSSGYSLPPAFDTNHEGHGGWCADGCSYPYHDILDNVYTILTNNPADVVLLHIGTNDISHNHENVAEVASILDEIKRYDPDITVILAGIISRTDGKAAQTTQYNDALYALTLSRIAKGDKIVWVDMENALNYVDDMCDAIHPNLSGYHKMANIWLDALRDILPPTAKLLSVQKAGSGEGRVMSNPKAIDCGSSCTGSFSYRAVVNLTATADHGSVFSGWDGCDSVNGNVCEVSMHSDRRVTADFRVASNVNLLFPTGGQIIPAGSQYTVAWEAPLNAVRFRLSGPKGCGIGTRFFTDTSATCDAPLLQKNKNNCFMKVIAYDSRNKKIGYDTPDSKFTIEVVTITSPNEETVCTGGQICPINWNKSVYVPATSIELYYSLKNGAKWSRIPGIEKLSPDAGTFNGWIAPNVSKTSTKCKLRIILRDSEGKIVGRHISVGTFTIQPVF